VKSKKWLISLGLAVVLVVALALTACTGDGEEWLHSPYTNEKIELTLTSDTTAIFYGWSQMVWEQLRDFGIDVTLTTMEPGAMTSALYDPVGGGLELFISGDHPANDPYSRWIWWYGLDQWYGEWNPTYYYNPDFEELFPLLYWQGEQNLTDVLMEIQEVYHGDMPCYMMMRPNSIVAYRTNEWEGWYEQMGGVVLWNNPFSILGVEWVGPEEGDRVLNIGFPDETSLDANIIQLMATEIGCLYSMICYEPMSTYARVGEENTEDPYVFKPGLITDYEVFDDERYCDIRGHNVSVQVWRLHVREGVKWHDYDTSGKNVTAEDIKWTLENHSSEWEYDKPVTWKLYWEGDEAANISAEEYLEWWIEIPDEEDPYTIDFVHDMPITEDTFPSWWTWEPIVPKHKFEGSEYPQELTGDHIGSGAFKFVSYETGIDYRFVRNDDWWGWEENGGEYVGDVEELFFNIRPDTGAWLMALEGGDDDWIQSPPPDALPDLEDNPDIQVYVAEGIGIYYLGFNHFVQPEVIEPGVGKGFRDYDLDEDDYPVWGYGGPYYDPEKNPLHDKVLREAIAYAINVTAMIDLVNDGYGELANSWVYSDSPAYNDDLEWYLFDDVKARNMLEDAGYWWE